MPRWLLAVFTFYFLLSISAPGFAAPAAAAAPKAAATVAVATTADPVQALALEHASGQCTPAADGTPPAPQDRDTPDRGVDLPEDQDFHSPAPGASPRHFACPQLASAPLQAPPPRRHLRPPRA